MKRLFLAASFNDVANILGNFEKDLSGKRVTFIPTASIVEKITFYVKAGKKALEKLGLTVDVLELSTATRDEINAKLRGNDYIYVTGGNTFYLLQELKRTGADKIIREEVAKGKLYIGESAGTVVAAQNIEYIKIMDSVEKAPHLSNFDAMDLVNLYTVPHYKNIPFKRVAQKIVDEYSDTLNLYPISNNEAILVEDDNIRVERN